MDQHPNRYRLINEPAQADFVREEVRRFLLEATERGCESLQATGVSFVLMGLGVWASELADAEPAWAASYFRALADIYDPSTSQRRKATAEVKRRKAFQALCAAAGALPRHHNGDHHE